MRELDICFGTFQRAPTKAMAGGHGALSPVEIQAFYLGWHTAETHALNEVLIFSFGVLNRVTNIDF